MKSGMPLVLTAILAALPLMQGCASLAPQLAKDSETQRTWQEDLRALGGHGSLVGVSEASRDIERSLGAARR